VQQPCRRHLSRCCAAALSDRGERRIGPGETALIERTAPNEGDAGGDEIALAAGIRIRKAAKLHRVGISTAADKVTE
jgi:hypothetical protein